MPDWVIYKQGKIFLHLGLGILQNEKRKKTIQKTLTNVFSKRRRNNLAVFFFRLIFMRWSKANQTTLILFQQDKISNFSFEL